jgi:hypothetical protein
MNPAPALASQLRGLSPVPFLIAAALAILAAAAAYLAAAFDKRATRAHAVEHLHELIRLQAAQSDAFVDRIAQSLKFIGHVREREGAGFDLDRLIRDGKLDMAEVLQFGFADHEGIVRQSNLPAGPTLVSIADRAHFQAVARDGESIHIGRPIFGRMAAVWLVQLAIPVRDAQGAFLGAAMASVELGTLGASLVSPGTQDVVALVGDDGVVRGWSRAEPVQLAEARPDHPLMARMRAHPSGDWEGHAPWAPGTELTVWRKLDAYPLYATVAVPAAGLTASADARARLYWAAAGLCAAGAFAVAGVFALRRARAEAALSDLRRADAALGRAVNDAPDLARLMRESKRLDLRVVDARLFARDAFEVARTHAGGAGVVCDFALDLPDGLRILADESRLRRVADALLGAAFDRAGRGGRVGFSVGARGLDARNVEIAIAVAASGETGPAQGRGNGVTAAIAKRMGGSIEHLASPDGTLDVFKAGFARAT